MIYVFDSVQSHHTEEEDATRKLIQGAELLSACWVGKSILAASDTASRCLLWDMTKDEPLYHIGNIEGVICSLLQLADGTLTGISSEGKLYFWEISGGELIAEKDVPIPPPVSGLIRMVYWPATNALVFPSQKGDLILFDLEDNKFRNLDAHDGDFYAVALWNDGLLTAGMEDCRMKVWSAGSDQPACDIQLQDGVISMGVAGGYPAKVLLVDTHGRAKVYILEENNLRCHCPINGKDYRVVAAPTLETLKAFHAQQKKDETSQILSEIQRSDSRLSEGAIDRLHERLKELGYEHISLAIRTEQADKAGDVVRALKNSFSLMQILPQNELNACPSMERYAGLLEKTCHFPEADAICSQILNIDHDYPLVIKPGNLKRRANLIEEEQCVIEPDIPIPNIIEAATVIGKQFSGRFLISKLDPLPCGRVRLTPQMIIEKYEQVCRETGDVHLPEAASSSVWWICRDQIDEVRLVTFGDGQSGEIKELQFALQVMYSDYGTEVIPVILFDYRNVGQSDSLEKINENASVALKRIKDMGLSTAYLSAIQKNFTQALRRLVTESKSQMKVQR